MSFQGLKPLWTLDIKDNRILLQNKTIRVRVTALNLTKSYVQESNVSNLVMLNSY